MTTSVRHQTNSRTTKRHRITASLKWCLSVIAPLMAAGSLVVAVAAYRVSMRSYQETREQNVKQRHFQEHTLKSEKKSHLVRILAEYHSLAFLYFYAETASQERDVPELEGRHVEYHRLDAELASSLEEVADIFGPCVQSSVGRLEKYFSEIPWEQQIQNDDFHYKLRADPPNKETLVETINRAIFVDQYIDLTRELANTMDADLAQVDGSSHPCEDRNGEIQITASSETVPVGTPVTFTCHWMNIPGEEYFVYSWSADEALSANRSKASFTFAYPGVKLVNVTSWMFSSLSGAQSGTGFVKKGFARSIVKVVPR